MSKPEWGEKRICPSCGIKYYDFNKTPIECPSCKFEFDPDLLLKSRKGRGFSAKQDQPNDNENIAVEEISKTDIAEISPNDEDILDIDDEEIVEIDPNLDNETVENISTENNDIDFEEAEIDDEDLNSIEIKDDETK